jgi:hypothetical protein
MRTESARKTESQAPHADDLENCVKQKPLRFIIRMGLKTGIAKALQGVFLEKMQRPACHSGE